MSIKLMSAIWPLPLPDSEKLVLLALADNANDDGACWPSIATIAKKCSKGERTIQRAISALIEAGHLSREDKPGRGTIWHLHPRHDDTPVKSAPVPRTTPTPVTVAPKPSRTIIPQKATPSSETRAKPIRVSTPDLPATVSAEQWSDFVEMRLSLARGPKPKPWTAGAAKAIARDLHRIVEDGDDPGVALERSTANGWAGVRFTPAAGRRDPAGLTNPMTRAAARSISSHPGGRHCAAADDVFGSRFDA